MRETILGIVEKYIGLVRPSGGKNVLVRCPFHKDGQEAKPSFSVDLERGIFNCFTCKIGGGIFWLLNLLGLPRPLIEAELADIKADLEQGRQEAARERRNAWVGSDPFLAEVILPEAVLKPFTQMRVTLPLEPTRLNRFGFEKTTLDHLQIGYDNDKMRVVYPIRDLYGNLAGVVGGTTIEGRMPKYLAYQAGVRDPETNRFKHSDFGKYFDKVFPGYVFHKSRYLWNFDNVYPRAFFSKEVEPLIIVEGFKPAMWLLQHGYRNTIALMTSQLSYVQKQLLMRLDSPIVLFLDNDEPGRDAAKKIGRELKRCMRRGVSTVRYPDGYDDFQPDHLSADEIAVAIQDAFTPLMKQKESIDVH